jgi:hypothetical protein
MGTNVLAVWICIDSPENATYFPSSKGMSSDKSIQAIYYKCAAVCLHSARLYNPDLKLVFFSNKNELPVVDGVDFEILFKALKVQFYCTPFEYVTPPDYSPMWRNQFYEFSILKFISNCSDFSDDDNIALIDCDCVITKKLDELFADIDLHQSIAYELDYNETVNINGNSRTDMKFIFSELSGKDLHQVPLYYAGEFFGATVSCVKEYFRLFQELWPKLLWLNEQGKPRLQEEAHVLSYLYFITQNENDIANKYIKRLWTHSSSYRNIMPNDENLHIWHLPKHKVAGFPKLFKFLKSKEFSFAAISKESYHAMIKKLFTVPDLTLRNRLYFHLITLAKRSLAGKRRLF